MSEIRLNKHVLNFVIENANGKMEFRITFDSENQSCEFEDFKTKVKEQINTVFEDEYVANYLKFEVERARKTK